MDNCLHHPRNICLYFECAHGSELICLSSWMMPPWGQWQSMCDRQSTCPWGGKGTGGLAMQAQFCAYRPKRPMISCSEVSRDPLPPGRKNETTCLPILSSWWGPGAFQARRVIALTGGRLEPCAMATCNSQWLFLPEGRVGGGWMLLGSDRKTSSRSKAGGIDHHL